VRVCVVGVGAVGGYFGGRLAQAGVDVVFAARGAVREELARSGLRVDSVCGDFRIHPVSLPRGPTEAGRVDAILLAVKAWQVTQVAPSLRPMVAGGAFVVPLQNGVEAHDQLATALGHDAVVGGYCRIGSVALAPGHIRHGWHANAAPLLAIGELGGRGSGGSARVDRLFAQLARASGMEARVEPDIERALWEKFVFLAAYAGVGAALQAPIGVVRAEPAARARLIGAIEEAARVGRARGIAVAGDIAEQVMVIADGLPPASVASMQRDMTAGRPSELDALVGAVPRLGREAGVATPLFDELDAVLRPRELATRGHEHAGGPAAPPVEERTAQ
jgi:2-dehydropantoate 2-reductase